MAASKEVALQELLTSLFDIVEFKKWLREDPECAEVADDLPAGESAPSATVDRAVGALSRRNLLDKPFFDRLIAKRPRRRDEIDGVAAIWGVSSGGGAQRPPEKRRDDREIPPEDGRVSLARVFLVAGWPAYGASELEQILQLRHYDGNAASVEALEMLLQVCIQGKRKLKLQRGLQHVDFWLRRNAGHAHEPTFRLWRSIYFNALRQHESAIEDLTWLTVRHPQSASVECIFGNQLSKLSTVTGSPIAHYENAARLNPNFLEARLELVEELIKGAAYRRALNKIDEFLDGLPLDSRARVIVKASRVVVLYLDDPTYRESPQYFADREEVGGIAVAEDEREEWHFDYVIEHIMDQARAQSGRADTGGLSNAGCRDLCQWLKGLEPRLSPSKA